MSAPRETLDTHVKQSNPRCLTGNPNVDFLCILDFEATCNKGGPPPTPQEIIEFPVLLLNTRTGEIEGEFHQYIRPDVHPTLSAFCTELTGIAQATVDAGISLDRAITLHMEWLEGLGLVPVHSENKTAASVRTFVYVTGGDWDLKTCLPRQLRYHSKQVPSIFQEWINIKWEFEELYGKRSGGLVRMLGRLGMELEGRQHSGIDDCRNIARVCQRMLRDGWVPGGLAAEPLRSAPKNPTIEALGFQSDDSSGLDYLCVLDFEATCSDKKPAPRPQEIIEFPTLLLNVNTGEVEREFHYYIKPDVHPILSAFCTELTGITQATVDAGISLDRAILLQQEWIGEIGISPSHGTETSSAPKFAYITCGDWDLKQCLPSQLQYHSKKVPSMFQSWINIKHEFQGIYGKKAGGMAGMLRMLGMELEGRHHSGIDDCRNIARICQRMLEDGWVPSRASRHAQSMPVAMSKKTMSAQKAAEADRRAAIRAEREETKRKKRERRARKIAQRTEEGF